MASRKGVTRRPAMVRPTKRRSSASRNSTSTLGRRASGEGRRVTPFLDAIVADSVSFEHFHANGAQTFHGLFASLCSSLPRQGTAATKARYANDYLCLPTLLTRGGYRTRMVIGQNRDRSHSRLGLFMARNGLEELIDEAAFPRSAPRMGLGVADGALLDRVRTEIDALRGGGRPYFLAALTTGTHHPFAVPTTHPDVAALRAEPDRYVAALRYLDLELERVLTGVRRNGAGIADGEGFWFYGFASRSLEHADLALRTPPRRWPAGDPAAAARVERILALYVTANALIEHNSLWSWREFGDRL